MRDGQRRGKHRPHGHLAAWRRRQRAVVAVEDVHVARQDAPQRQRCDGECYVRVGRLDAVHLLGQQLQRGRSCLTQLVLDQVKHDGQHGDLVGRVVGQQWIRVHHVQLEERQVVTQ